MTLYPAVTEAVRQAREKNKLLREALELMKLSRLEAKAGQEKPKKPAKRQKKAA